MIRYLVVFDEMPVKRDVSKALLFLALLHEMLIRGFACLMNADAVSCYAWCLA